MFYAEKRTSWADRLGRQFVKIACLTGHRFVRAPLSVKFALSITIFSLLVGLGVVTRSALQSIELERAAGKFRSLGLPSSTIPILIPVYSRPEYFRQMLEALRKNSHISEAVLIFSQDGSIPEISALIDTVDFAPIIHLRHSPPYLGIPSLFIRTDAPTASNIHFLMRCAFDYLNVAAAVILEADLELSVDGYDYFRWAHAQMLASPDLRSRVLTVNGYTEQSDEAGDPFAFDSSAPGFMVWGWLCPESSWPIIRDHWTWFHNWDITLEKHAREGSGKVSLAPLVSRVRNIGMQGINFNVQDATEQRRWLRLYTPREPIDYSRAELRFNARGFRPAS